MAEYREAHAAAPTQRSVAARSTSVTDSAPPDPRGRVPRVLVVCTGNICRSPVAEHFLRHHLEALGSDVVVQSAGLHPSGERTDADVVKLLRRRGFRARRHRGARLTPELLAEADLVVGMASEHTKGVTHLAPETLPRVFTLKELIRRSETVGGPRPEEALDDWVARLHSGRTLSGLRSFSPRDDISDPIGGSMAEYEAMADEVEDLTRRFAELIAGAPIEPLGGSDLGSEENQSTVATDRTPPPSSPTTPTGEPGRSLGPVQEAVHTVAHLGEDTTLGTSPEAEDANAHELSDPAGLPALAATLVDELRTARDALQEAQRTARDTAQELAEVLRSAPDAKPTGPADAYAQLGDEVAAVMRSAAEQASVVREEAERFAHYVRAQAEAEALAMREQSQSDASATLGKAEDGRSTLRREAEAAAATLTANAEDQAQVMLREAADEAKSLVAEATDDWDRASTEAAALRQAVIAETAELRDDADHYATSTRQQADEDAGHIRDEADRYVINVRGTAEVQSTELLDQADHDATAIRRAAEVDARAMRKEAERDAVKLVTEARSNYAELLTAEENLRSRLEGAAGALVAALEGQPHVVAPPLALPASEDDEPG